MNNCELCSQSAQIYCQSDNASLCYDCDHNVHSANFLVAKHSRTLLCHKCQSPTPWSASGLNLGRAVTVCVNCDSPHRPMILANRRNDVVADNRVHDDTESSDNDDDADSDEDEDDDDDEDAENQVVPWSSVVSPRVTGSCSSSDEYCSSRSEIKRGRFDDYTDSEEDIDTVCSSKRSNSKRRTEIDDVTSLRSR
ncbi:uncharacterized protein [Rutidosis leptorrhynchoides]|uniref:uncharacterized protein n=1 Tax=Rutidosis leptorrhynchoides TaxID=125765 RepID=UPI003A994CA2